MGGSDPKSLVAEVLNEADIEIGGERPWDVRVNDDTVYKSLISGNTLAVGDQYIAGGWDCERVDELIHRVLVADLPSRARGDVRIFTEGLKSRIINSGIRAKAFQIGQHHYDIGNDLYQVMLDRRMVYSCAYWKNAKTLDEAQEAKLDLICRKLNLSPGMRVLDIGGGWGSFAKYAAEKYGVSVVNITVSREQIELANEMCQGLDVENRLLDYRDVDETFDAIVSVGMFEHVGYKNYSTYFQAVANNLAESGLFLLHTIGGNRSTHNANPWIDKHIFPNSMIPSIRQIGQAIEDLFVVEDWHNFGADYDPTLMAWYDNFKGSWDSLKDRYGDEFFRMWKLYLQGCAGTFRARSLQVWQIVLSRGGVQGGYMPVR